jgi:hypothetical protein
MERLSNNVTEEIQLWKHIKHLKNYEDGDNTFSETSGRASAKRYQFHEDTLIDTAVKALQKRVVFQHCFPLWGR